MIQPLKNSRPAFVYGRNEEKKSAVEIAAENEQIDKLEISNTAKVFSKVEKFLDLSDPNRLSIQNLNGAEKEEFIKMLSGAIKAGIVGYEVLEVNGKPEKHELVNEIADSRLKGAKPYRKNGGFHEK